jgi:hypothetical protein
MLSRWTARLKGRTDRFAPTPLNTLTRVRYSLQESSPERLSGKSPDSPRAMGIGVVNIR